MNELDEMKAKPFVNLYFCKFQFTLLDNKLNCFYSNSIFVVTSEWAGHSIVKQNNFKSNGNTDSYSTLSLAARVFIDSESFWTHITCVKEGTFNFIGKQIRPPPYNPQKIVHNYWLSKVYLISNSTLSHIQRQTCKFPVHSYCNYSNVYKYTFEHES